MSSPVTRSSKSNLRSSVTSPSSIDATTPEKSNTDVNLSQRVTRKKEFHLVDELKPKRRTKVSVEKSDNPVTVEPSVSASDISLKTKNAIIPISTTPTNSGNKSTPDSANQKKHVIIRAPTVSKPASSSVSQQLLHMECLTQNSSTSRSRKSARIATFTTNSVASVESTTILYDIKNECLEPLDVVEMSKNLPLRKISNVFAVHPTSGQIYVYDSTKVDFPIDDGYIWTHTGDHFVWVDDICVAEKYQYELTDVKGPTILQRYVYKLEGSSLHLVHYLNKETQGKMPIDTLICGSCNSTFHELDAFLKHKTLPSCHIKILDMPSLEVQSEDIVDPGTSIFEDCLRNIISETTGTHEILEMDESGAMQELVGDGLMDINQTNGPTVTCESCGNLYLNLDDYSRHECSGKKQEERKEKIVTLSVGRPRKRKNETEVKEIETKLRRYFLAGVDNEAEDIKPVLKQTEKPEKPELAPLPDTLPTYKSINFKPLFDDDTFKVKYLESLRVDIGPMVSHLYTERHMSKNLNKNAPPRKGNQKSFVTIYSCKVCDKEYSVKHLIQRHCVIHTDLQPFKCFLCDHTSNASSSLYNHMREHTGKLYNCEHCEFTAKHRSALASHQRRRHFVPKEMQECEVCGREYSSVDALVDHVKGRHKDELGLAYLKRLKGDKKRNRTLFHCCEICNEMFINKAQLKNHMMAHIDQPNIAVNQSISADESNHDTESFFKPINNAYSCEVCDKSLSTLSLFEKHLQLHPFIYVCCVCSKKFQSTAQLKDHLYGNHNDDEEKFEEFFQRSIDMSIFLPDSDGSMDDWISSDPAMIALAMTTTEGMTGYIQLGFRPMNVQVYNQINQSFGKEECEYCGRLYFYAYKLEEHRRTHTGDRPFACQQCFYQATRKGGLIEHIQRVHEKKKYTCFCGFVASDRARFWYHRRKHEKPIACFSCNLTFNRPTRLRIHLEAVHKEMTEDQIRESVASFRSKKRSKIGHRVHFCKECNRSFSTSEDGFKRHLMEHGDERPYQCSECGFSAKQRRYLISHARKHTSEKPFLCSICGNSYKTKTWLKVHAMSHTGIKLLECDQCPYKTNVRADLKKHIDIHRNETMQCSLCKHSTSTVRYLKEHYKRAHPGAKYDGGKNLTAEQQLGLKQRRKSKVKVETEPGPSSDMFNELVVDPEPDPIIEEQVKIISEQPEQKTLRGTIQHFVGGTYQRFSHVDQFGNLLLKTEPDAEEDPSNSGNTRVMCIVENEEVASELVVAYECVAVTSS